MNRILATTAIALTLCAPVAAYACNDDAAQVMWDTANSMACPGVWMDPGSVEPFNRMVGRSNCEERANALRQKAKMMLCPAPSVSDVGDLAEMAKEAPKYVADVAPQNLCDDRNKPDTCQIDRAAAGPGGYYRTRDLDSGEHVRCFAPGEHDYEVCVNEDGRAWGEIFNPRTNYWDYALKADANCTSFGIDTSAEYLACESQIAAKAAKTAADAAYEARRGAIHREADARAEALMHAAPAQSDAIMQDLYNEERAK